MSVAFDDSFAIPPPREPAALLAMVILIIVAVAVPSLKIPPPRDTAVLVETVVFRYDDVPRLCTAPPREPAKFSEIDEPVTVSDPVL